MINDSNGPGSGGGMGSGSGGRTGGGANRGGVNGVGYPTCVYCPRPDYSKEAREKEIEGIVVLEVLVSREGKATEVKVLKSLGYGLDEKAIKAVKEWKFQPAIVNATGKAAGPWIQVEINFQFYK
jgi:periplasmic protein TonB